MIDEADLMEHLRCSYGWLGGCQYAVRTHIIEWASAQVPPTPLYLGGTVGRERERQRGRGRGRDGWMDGWMDGWIDRYIDRGRER